MIYIFLIIILSGAGYYFLFYNKSSKTNWRTPNQAFPSEWRAILKEYIAFYNALSIEEKTRFEYKIQDFILNYEIIPVRTSITIKDKVLVASSAVIPIFGFEDWRYSNLNQILIYPTMFNHNFETDGQGRRILGMVGNGYMEGTMILSQEALIHGFKNDSDKKNTAIHEFVHLIDKTGGTIDGIPSVLMQKQYAIPWMDMINQKLEEIYDDKSDINPYGGTNKAEFFSVASEYFFERPKLLKRKHPDLYAGLERVFKQDMSSRNLNKSFKRVGRNSPCPCNSGKKYIKCCGKH